MDITKMFLIVIFALLFNSIYSQELGSLSLCKSEWHAYEGKSEYGYNKIIFDINTIHNESLDKKYYKVYFLYTLPYKTVFGDAKLEVMLYKKKKYYEETYYDLVKWYKLDDISPDWQSVYSSFLVEEGNDYVISIYSDNGWLMKESSPFNIINTNK